MVAAATLLLVLASTAPASAPASAFTIPDAAVLAQLRRRHHPGRSLRVTSGTNRYLLRARDLDERGLVELSPGHNSPLPPDPFPWSRIERIDFETNRKTYGTIMGGIVGGLAGLLAPAVPSGYPTDGSGSPRTWFVAGAVVGGFAGRALGAGVMREHPFYEAEPVPLPPRVAASTPAAPPAAAAPASIDSARAPALANPVVAEPAPAAAPVTAREEIDVNAVPTFVHPRVGLALKQFKSGDLLRIDCTYGRFHGYASRSGPGGLAGLRAEPNLASFEGHRSLTWDEIQRIDRRGGSAGPGAIHGAATGGAVTGVLSVLVLLAVASAANGSATTGEVFGVAAGATAIGAAVGALIGAGIGAAVPGWHRVYVQ